MTVSVRVTQLGGRDRRWIAGVYREYLNDLAPQGTGAFPALTEVGHRATDLLDGWFTDRNAQVITIARDEQPAGFALVRMRPPFVSGKPESHMLAEFYVDRVWRRHGIGGAAARLIFDRFAGEWHITQNLSNASAVEFWRRVVRDYTAGVYRERTSNGEMHQFFTSMPRRPLPPPLPPR
jgi:predicted acetyltransferase